MTPNPVAFAAVWHRMFRRKTFFGAILLLFMNELGLDYLRFIDLAGSENSYVARKPGVDHQRKNELPFL